MFVFLLATEGPNNTYRLNKKEDDHVFDIYNTSKTLSIHSIGNK